MKVKEDVDDKREKDKEYERDRDRERDKDRESSRRDSGRDRDRRDSGMFSTMTALLLRGVEVPMLTIACRSHSRVGQRRSLGT